MESKIVCIYTYIYIYVCVYMYTVFNKIRQIPFPNNFFLAGNFKRKRKFRGDYRLEPLEF